MQRQLIGWMIALAVMGTAQAATLEIPGPRTALSGIGVISGWKCNAGELTVRFDGGAPIPLLYGAERKDVLDAGACDQANVGFVSIWNWGNLGDGFHTAVVYDDGVEFDRSTFEVVTPGLAFLRGVHGSCEIPDFPAPGETSHFEWNEATQHLELAAVTGLPISQPTLDDMIGRWVFTSALGTETWVVSTISGGYAYGRTSNEGVLFIQETAQKWPSVAAAGYPFLAYWETSSYCFTYVFTFTGVGMTEGRTWSKSGPGSCPVGGPGDVAATTSQTS